MKKKNILILAYWSYSDALIQTYTLPYVKMIRKTIHPDSKLFLVTLEHKHLMLNNDEKKKTRKELNQNGIQWIALSFTEFSIKAIIRQTINLFILSYICFMYNIKKIHAWCTPAGMTGFLLSKLCGASLVIDGFEPHAEPSVENGHWKKGGFAFRLLFFFEKLQTKHASHIIATSTYLEKYVKDKYKLKIKSLFIKPALIDLQKFSLTVRKNTELLRKYNLNEKIVCVYAGKLGGIYLDQEIFDFYRSAYECWGDKFCALMLTPATREEVEGKALKSFVPKESIVSMYLNHEEIPIHMGLGDFAINPVKTIESKRCCTSIKDGEYWALGLPVIITDSLGDDADLIRSNGTGVVLQSLEKSSYTKAIIHIDNLLKRYSTEEIYQKVRPLAEKHRNYGIAETIYCKIYGK